MTDKSVGTKISRPEIVIALCGAAGTDLNHVMLALKKSLVEFDYTVQEIILSNVISDVPKYNYIKNIKNEDKRIKESIDAGNEIRENSAKHYGLGDGVARLAVAEIVEHRKKINGHPEKPVEGTAYVIKSLKHHDEYVTLKSIYDDAFFMISVYEPKRKRLEKLSLRIAKSYDSHDSDKYTKKALKIIDRDEKESAPPFGQEVRDVFPLGDGFVEFNSTVTRQIRRIVRLCFGAPFITPTKTEHGMFHAHSTARRSADLSRQVGAVITNDDGDIISTGCNEVPKSGGGMIWDEQAGTSLDHRDFKIGYDSSAALKVEILKEVVNTFFKAKWFKKSVHNKGKKKLLDDVIEGNGISFKGKRITSIIEYGRIVHAEMSALMSAARRGAAVQQATLYCNVFPCHMCARHIISAGIKRVVYIEPYPKSLAKRLYENEIRVDRDRDAEATAVDFVPFVGVAPKQYMNLFEAGTRKDKKGFAVSEAGKPELRNIAKKVTLPPDKEAVYVDTLKILFGD